MAKEKRAKEPKPEKIKKAPGFYKKTLTEKKLESRYLKYIEVPADRTFIRSCYIKQDDGYRIRTDLNEKEVKRLKLLQKAVKTNRKGPVNIVPLAAAAVLIAGLVFFFTVLLNPILEKALETGLEAVFDAKVDADRFNLSILRFEIGMDGLTIADRDSPMTNLIQFSRMDIRLKPQAALRGKVYIEEIRADAVRFGTPRTVSGALPDKPPKEKKPVEKSAVPPLVDFKNFDATALLNQEYGKLLTPKLYDAAIDAYDTAAAKWKAQADNARARIEELNTRARPLLALNINDYKTLDRETIARIQTTVAEINTLSVTVQAAADDVNGIVTGIQDDVRTAADLEQNARNAVAADLDHLKSYLDLSSGAAMEVIEPVIRDILTGSALTYLAYGERALEVLEKVKALQAQLPKSSKPPAKAEKEKFKGRDVEFPVVNYPRFFLGTLATDVLTPGNWHWGFNLQGVSSDPDLSDTPVDLVLFLEEAGDGLNRTAAFKGRADFRSGAGERFNAEVSGGGFPVDLSGDLSRAGIGGFSGNASFTLALAGLTDGSFTGAGDISLARSRLLNPSNTVAEAVSEVIAGVPSLDLGLKYEHFASAEDRFSVTTNIGNLVADALKKMAAQYVKKAEDELEKALRAKIDQYIDGRFVNKEELDALFRAARGDRAAVDQLRNMLNNKKNEFEQKLRNAAEEAVNQAKEEVKEQAEQAVKDALEGKVPSLPSAPSLPNPFRR
ncbi:MAG: hypothetical protein LBC62_09205 [Treponema sp.]|nr:hypothetical protein [Treponema sp.]